MTVNYWRAVTLATGLLALLAAAFSAWDGFVFAGLVAVLNLAIWRRTRRLARRGLTVEEATVPPLLRSLPRALRRARHRSPQPTPSRSHVAVPSGDAGRRRRSTSRAPQATPAAVEATRRRAQLPLGKVEWPS